jgi:hypothetical protein
MQTTAWEPKLRSAWSQSYLDHWPTLSIITLALPSTTTRCGSPSCAAH